MSEPTNKHDAAQLEAGYASWHRAYEYAGILITASSSVWLCARIAKCQPLSGWWVPLATLIGLLLADFTSGFVHWLFDTWGSVDTPLFGGLAIRTFRHHHVDQSAITRHDFVETNGHNIALASSFTIGGLVYVTPERATLPDVFMGMCLVACAFFTSVTSQIHKWAHMARPPRFIKLLQRARLVLSPGHHSLHHSAPYNRSYCITVGWMNGPLRRIRFFETLERAITSVTGALPREDDLGKEAALEIAEEIGEGVGPPIAAEKPAPRAPDPGPRASV